MSMMHVQTMDRLVDQLRCSRCKGYLKWPPVVLLSDGTSACGHCTPPLAPENPDGSIVRELVLEKVLRRFTFPCKHQSLGCRERHFFGYENHNEDECIYRPLTCPADTCPWTGSTFTIMKHFTEAHGAMVKPTLDFKVNLNEDAEDIILSFISNVPYLLRFNHRAKLHELYIEINSLNMEYSFHKIWLINNDMKDCGVSLKRQKCYPYISERCDGITINLEKYLPVLENPGCMIVSTKIIFEKKAAPINITFKSGVFHTMPRNGVNVNAANRTVPYAMGAFAAPPAAAEIIYHVVPLQVPQPGGNLRN